MTSYSHSSLDTFRICPRKFRYAYIDKVPVVRVVTADTYLGTAVHRVLKNLYTLGADGVLLAQDEAMSAYRAEWDKLDTRQVSVTSDYYTVDDYIRIGEEILGRHYERYQPFNQGTLLGAELYLDFVLPNTPFRFRSYIDRLWKRDDDTVEICDYKTGQALMTADDPRFLAQMGLYQLAVQAKYPGLDDIELAQYLLRKDMVIRRRLRPDELDELAESLRQAVVNTIEAARLGDFPAQEGTHCVYCNYQDRCPAKVHRRLLEEEESEEDRDLAPEEARELADRFLAKLIQSRRVGAELDSLKEQLVQLAKRCDVSRFDGDTGKVTVSIRKKEKFVTKSEDARAFAELTALCRRMRLDEYFTLDGRGLMSNVYTKKSLPPEQLEELGKFVSEAEQIRVVGKPEQDTEEERDED
ncbi:MAG: PD-(D/E)XK nuclease family protein [Candidatus Zixiibacteriota bacterium]|nr:MAG: PD-(D/E)XK nuclease family protein [candidate division Zixibacteria bacterium]